MKKYYYGLDEFNRFTQIYEVTPENEESLSYYFLGEFNEEDISKIISNETGLIDGKIQYIGEQPEEKKRRETLNLKSELEEVKE
jgi:hypothetical protein